MEEVVLMIDAYLEEQLNAKFEAAFAAANLTPQRTHPKSYTPTPKDQIPVPWYLAPFEKGNQGDS